MFPILSLELVHWDYWQRVALPLDAPIVTIVGPNDSGETTLPGRAMRHAKVKVAAI